MDKIKDQANKVSQLVFASDTGAAYQKTFSITWEILRETGVLVWLVLCLGFVAGEWFWRNSIALGRNARSWYVSFSEKDKSPEEQSFSATGKAILEAGQSGATYLLTKAREQLGIKAPETPVAPSAAPPASASQQQTPAPAPAAPSAKAAPAKAASDAPASDTSEDEIEDV